MNECSGHYDALQDDINDIINNHNAHKWVLGEGIFETKDATHGAMELVKRNRSSLREDAAKTMQKLKTRVSECEATFASIQDDSDDNELQAKHDDIRDARDSLKDGLMKKITELKANLAQINTAKMAIRELLGNKATEVEDTSSI